MSAQIDQICQSYKIVGYLQSKGIEPTFRGKKTRYRCMLPNHTKDNTPSFYVTEMPDGREVFKCFGCGASGGIIALIRMMENHKSNGVVIRKLAKILHLNLDYIADTSSIEPSPELVLNRFCEEDGFSFHIANTAKEYIKANWTSEDAVNKIAMVYRQIDQMIEEGREKEIVALFEKLIHAIETYES